MADVFITELKINKVRHLENITIPLAADERKHLILTGKNGSGKTSVLLAAKNYLRAIESSQLKFLQKLIQEIESIKNLYKNSLAKGADNNLKASEQNAKREKRINSRQKIIDQFYKGIIPEFNSIPVTEQLYTKGDFIYGAFDAERISSFSSPEGIKKIELKDNYGIDEHPGSHFLQYLVNLKADRSFARDDNDMETVDKITRWFDFFENSLKKIFEDDTLRLEFDRKNYTFSILRQGREKFDFNTLSDGYSAILNIVTDLILRMEKHRVKNYDIQGVVLIDEIEAHLHIELQKKILPFLTEFFPKIQFIVSTHSPFVLNSVDNAVIYDLENRLLVTDLSGYSYEGIVESYFDADSYSEKIKSKIQAYEALVNKSDRSESEEEQMMSLRMYLKEIPAKLSKELVAKFHQIELSRIGKKNG
ncbi:ATPase AAA [Desulfonema ishimotonii]|uniref:ATPase AAA n=1 Tax=Desulfonema ishimotonii TaxID=45657 RepID=A0A401G0R3_9BACT|nr:ATP-binding protein [Desulfonema ishimotonii]GBC62809.1 ATPase AAA [Desulfonema ishimotonii]